jgi:hypothetical protein
MGCFQAKETADNKQDRSREEQENTHRATIYRNLAKQASLNPIAIAFQLFTISAFQLFSFSVF